MSAVLEYPQKHPISAEEYLRMGEAGVFAPEARLELIEGEIIEMAPIGPPHLSRVNKLNKLFVQRVGDRAIVSVQNSLVIAERSVPQPDVVLLAPREDEYSRSMPRASDVLLVVEVSDSTLKFDLRTKVPLYARCGIAEAWVVDVNDRVVHVFREPGEDGYRSSASLKAGQAVACAALPDVRIQIDQLFPA
jgi:Uma2 family endonuclease